MNERNRKNVEECGMIGWTKWNEINDIKMIRIRILKLEAEIRLVKTELTTLSRLDRSRWVASDGRAADFDDRGGAIVSSSAHSVGVASGGSTDQHQDEKPQQEETSQRSRITQSYATQITQTNRRVQRPDQGKYWVVTWSPRLLNERVSKPKGQRPISKSWTSEFPQEYKFWFQHCGKSCSRKAPIQLFS